jgi:CubicO group peptidase (beta-lactamase class C family)
MRNGFLLHCSIAAVLLTGGQPQFSDSLDHPNTAYLAVNLPATDPDIESDQSARIARIENGLLPAVVIKGRVTPAMKLVDRMAHYKVPGVSVAFFDHGRVLWTRTYGFADLASQKPVSTETLFQAGSVSKPVSALAALRLVQDGKLNLDENVNSKLRSWTVPENEFTKEQKVTLRRILSHTAGLTVHGFPGHAAGEPIPTIVQILNGEKPANTAPIRVDAVPGTLWRYSGGGYIVLQLLLNEVTGKPFPQILHDLVLQPIEMDHSTFTQPLPEAASKFAATPYLYDGEPVKGGWHTYPEMAAGGLWTTPTDLARLAIEVQNEYAGKSDKVLSREMMHQMLSHQQDDWGLGFELESPGDAQSFGHSGDDAGFQCDLIAYIDSTQGLAIMTNSDNGYQIGDEVLRAVSKEYGWPDFKPKERELAKIDPGLLSRYAGTYKRADIGNQIVTVENGRVYLQTSPLGPQPEELFPQSDTDFFILSQDVTFSFREDGQGRVSKLITHIGTEDREATRIPSNPK